MHFVTTVFVVLTVCFGTSPSLGSTPELTVVTVATDDNEASRRYVDSARHFRMEPTVLGLNQRWTGGNVALYPGGGQKINMLKRWMNEAKLAADAVVMFTDAYDVLLLSTSEEIVSKFRLFDSRIVFSAEVFCWPDQSLATRYPPTAKRGYPYLNSGMFIGYAADIKRLVNNRTVEDAEDDQLFYTNLFLSADRSLALDSTAMLFQNLNGATDDVTLVLDRDHAPMLSNTVHGTFPSVVHGNGASKIFLNSLSNYLPDQKVPAPIDFSDSGAVPLITMAVFLDEPTPFADTFLSKLAKLDYPKNRIDLVIFCLHAFHEATVDHFSMLFASEYKSYEEFHNTNGLTRVTSREKAASICLNRKCDYMLVAESTGIVTNASAITDLLGLGKDVVAPLLKIDGHYWSNFWGDVASDGFYKRSLDYMDIVQRSSRGVWNVPYVSTFYLVKSEILTRGVFSHRELDYDMAFCANLRNLGIFLHVANIHEYGYLLEMDNFEYHHRNNDLYQVAINNVPWEEKYIHQDYYDQLKQGKIPHPCPDVYSFPFTTFRFCDDLVSEMENYGEWSGGGNIDDRIAGGYENVPTVDIHLKQIGLESQWFYMLEKYVSPMQTIVYPGHSSTNRAYMNFVVKYHPEGQYLLKPHNDASTFTINMALNSRGTDFEGGGSRFIRYNCSVLTQLKGWALMHPGKLTHWHEGLRTTSGTRYILVSFIDP